MKKDIKPLSRKDEIVVQELNGEVLIYDLRTNKAFCLNETSSLVWEACDGNTSVSDISRSISRKLNAPANDDLVWLALDQLKKEKLIANGDEVISNFEGMSRREVIRKVGLASVVALPLVAGLVAPTAAHAASACPVVACSGGTGAPDCAAQPLGCRNCIAAGSGSGRRCGP